NLNLDSQFDRPGCAGCKLALQKSFDGQFVQVLKTSALQDLDLVHLAVLVQLQAKATSSLRAVDYESHRIFRSALFDRSGRPLRWLQGPPCRGVSRLTTRAPSRLVPGRTKSHLRQR